MHVKTRIINYYVRRNSDRVCRRAFSLARRVSRLKCEFFPPSGLNLPQRWVDLTLRSVVTAGASAGFGLGVTPFLSS